MTFATMATKLAVTSLMGAALMASTVVPAFAQTQPTDGTAAMTTTQARLDAPAARWNTVLGTYVKPLNTDGVALFDYAGLKASPEDRAALTAYIDYLAGQTPSTMDAPQATAYWANLYNALTVDVVIDNYPVKSIKDIKSGLFTPGPWKKKLVTVEGKKLTLDDIEHGILRVKYPSPLIHYMVNCASIGCPNLKDGLWTADTLEADREAAARDFINAPNGVTIKGDKLTVSSIYNWFKEDFGTTDDNILAHLSDYAGNELKAAIEGGASIARDDYNWSLNDARNK
ncbi:DUF547 domain-containing protein [Fretibacter rubidus]|uniref:DUF547 domain-containing protein n=1 Tax=Fretibacter rubidus TaxID=570162 RepID=UPI00352A8F65